MRRRLLGGRFTTSTVIKKLVVVCPNPLGLATRIKSKKQKNFSVIHLLTFLNQSLNLMVILKTINGTKVERLKKLRNSTSYEIGVVETMTRTHFSC